MPRRPRDLPLPAQPLGHGHPEPRAADVDRRHVRGHVPARLQPRQPLAHGADALASASSSTTRSSCSRTSSATWRWARRRCEAALDGSREIGFTILSMTISLAAVFIPVLFMGGIVGRLFHEFAVTIGVAILVSGFVSLTLTPMLCSRFLQPARRAAARPVLRGLGARLRRRCSTLYERTLTAVAAAPRGDDGRLGARSSSATGVPLRGHARRASCPSEDTGQIFGFTEARAGHLVRGDGASTSRQVAAIVAQDPNVDAFMSSVGAARAERGRQPGPHLHAAQAARRARLSADEVIAGAAAEARPQVPGIRVFLAEPAADPHRRAAHEEPLPVHAAGPGHGRALPRARRSSRRSCASSPGLAGRRRATCRSGTRRSTSRSTATGRSPLGVTRAADRGRALHRLRRAPGLDDLRAEQPVPGDPGAAAASTSATRRRSRLLYVRSASGAASCRSTPSAGSSRAVGPLTVNHLGQLPAVTISFNLRPGASLGDAVSEVETRRARDAARDDHHELPGHRAGLPGVAARASAGCCSSRSSSSTSCSASSTRASSTRSRSSRACRPPASARSSRCSLFRPGAERLRLRRHHHARRPRQEERDHDDRLRARGAAHGGQDARRRDLRGAASSASARS